MLSALKSQQPLSELLHYFEVFKKADERQHNFNYSLYYYNQAVIMFTLAFTEFKTVKIPSSF